MTDTAPRDFYVSMVRGARRALLAGPFDTHADALARVAEATRVASDVDPWAWFDAFGTCSLPRADGNPRGTLNERMGLAA